MILSNKLILTLKRINFYLIGNDKDNYAYTNSKLDYSLTWEYKNNTLIYYINDTPFYTPTSITKRKIDFFDEFYNENDLIIYLKQKFKKEYRLSVCNEIVNI